MGLLQKLFGSHSDHELKRIYPIVDKIEREGEKLKNLDTADLRAKTDEFKARYQAGESLDDLLPEAFAVAREMCDRILGMRPFRVQLIGGIGLKQVVEYVVHATNTMKEWWKTATFENKKITADSIIYAHKSNLTRGT